MKFLLIIELFILSITIVQSVSGKRLKKTLLSNSLHNVTSCRLNGQICTEHVQCCLLSCRNAEKGVKRCTKKFSPIRNVKFNKLVAYIPKKKKHPKNIR